MSTDILIIINPNSGTSQSEEYFQSFINLYPLDNYDLIISKNRIQAVANRASKEI